MDKSSNFHTVRGYHRLEQNEKQLTSAMEDYLEMIYRNSQINGYMRINTLSELLNVAAPSATKMVQNLSKLGLVDYKRYEYIILTEKGREIGKYLLYRHTVIEAFLKHLGVRDELLADTELMEHDLSDSTVRKINILNKYIEQNPEMLTGFKEFERSFSE